jgi:hypothetical protein
MALTAADRIAVKDLMGRYCLMVDAGDEAWVDLFLEDGVLDGVPASATPGAPRMKIAGREALRSMPRGSRENGGGFWRHHLTSAFIDEVHDGARFQGYSLVTDWRNGGKLLMSARYDAHAVPTSAGWRFKHIVLEIDQ